jgi:hypothetical protein
MAFRQIYLQASSSQGSNLILPNMFVPSLAHMSRHMKNTQTTSMLVHLEQFALDHPEMSKEEISSCLLLQENTSTDTGLAVQQGMPRTLTFADRFGFELVDKDDDVDDDNDSAYDPAEHDDNSIDDHSNNEFRDDDDNSPDDDPENDDDNGLADDTGARLLPPPFIDPNGIAGVNDDPN